MSLYLSRKSMSEQVEHSGRNRLAFCPESIGKMGEQKDLIVK